MKEKIKIKEEFFQRDFPEDNQVSGFPHLLSLLNSFKCLNKATGKSIGIYPEIKSSEFHQKNNKDITRIVYSIIKNYKFEDNPKKIFIQSFFPKNA